MIGTGILLVIVAGIAFSLHKEILKTSPNTQIEDARNDKLASLCGEIVGVGTVVIWFACFRRRSK